MVPHRHTTTNKSCNCAAVVIRLQQKKRPKVGNNATVKVGDKVTVKVGNNAIVKVRLGWSQG